jgi:YgiT-type zinc finger domain-containing protein
MNCTTPACDGEREGREISHSLVYRERTIIIHHVPAEVCPGCGEARLAEETTLHLEVLLRRKARARGTAFRFEV